MKQRLAMGILLWAGHLAAGCGHVPPEVGAMGRTAEDAADGAGDAGEAVVEGAKAIVQHVEREVDEAINKAPLKLRRRMCAQEEGTWTDTITVGACENGQATLTIGDSVQTQTCMGHQEGAVFEDQCLHADSAGAWYFNDGPSVPHILVAADADILQWNEIFWQAAVNHDYCYHHGEATYGYSRDTCDEQMLDDLLATCQATFSEDGRQSELGPNFNHASCSSQAHKAYMALVYGGEDNFDAMNTRVWYPAYEPLWRKRGLPQQPGDDALREMIRERPLDAIANL